MRRFVVFFFVLVSALLALYTSAGCSGGIDQLSPQNSGSEALNTCDGIDCVDGNDSGADSATQTSIYENLICTKASAESIDNDSDISTTPYQITGDNIDPLLNSSSVCGKSIQPPIMLDTNEPVLPFQPVVFCNDAQIPFNNPHGSCSAVSDIGSHYINIPSDDFGVCVLRLDDKTISTPYFVYRTNGPELTRYEILRTCVEQFSCTLGTFRSATIPLIEAAAESSFSSSDITFTVMRAVDGVIVEASDADNLANTALLLEDVGLAVDDDLISHNQSFMDEVIAFIETNCVE